MKKITMHRQVGFSWSSCYSKRGTPIANNPPFIMVESPTLKWDELEKMIDQHIATNGYDFDNVRDYLYSIIPNDFVCTVYNNRKTTLSFMDVGGVPWRKWAVAVVQKCIKDIIEQFPATRKEYLFKSINIYRKGEIVSDADYYLLIMPNIPKEELIISKCLHRDSENNCAVIFDDINEWNIAYRTGKFSEELLVLPAKYKDLQMLHLGRDRLFVSDKITVALNIASYYATGYEFGETLLFDE